MKKRFLIIPLSLVLLLTTLFFMLVRLLNYFPEDIETVPVYNGQNNHILEKDRPIKVLCWNVQYMAGKDYIFFYDLLDGSGPDEMPSRSAVQQTIGEAARVINEEKPDIILLQEVDDRSKRTYHEDQLKKLLTLISGDYKSHTSAFYHKSAFVPHPRIMGAVRMKLSTISKYKMKSAFRHQLALKPDNWVRQQFDLKRAVLETRFPLAGAREFIVYNTHLSAFSQNTDTLKKQVGQIRELLKSTSAAGRPWVIGGDFNLLPNRKAYKALGDYEKQYYNPETEMAALLSAYRSFPSRAAAASLDPAFFTHFPNHPDIKGPDRIIDYLLFSEQTGFISGYVRRQDTLKISDHLPLISVVKIKN